MMTLYPVTFFNLIKDTSPQRKSHSWAQLCALLTSRSVRQDKDGRLISPASYEKVVYRANENVESVSLLFLDFDNGMASGPLKKCWEAAGYAFIVYSSHSNADDFPKWRAVFPLAAPVPAAEWPAAYKAMTLALGQGQIDESCKDISRMYYLPSCPAETKSCAFAYSVEGAALDPADFPLIEETPAPPVAPVRMAAPEGSVPASGTLPGTDFDNRGAGSAFDLMQMAGWDAQRHGEGWHMTRPGKDKKQGHSATFNICFPNGLHVFSENAAPFEAGGNYSPFAIYARLKHDGDFSEAARALYAEGYGDRIEATREKEDRPLLMRPPAAIEQDAVLTFEQWQKYGRKLKNWKSRCDDEFRWQGGDWWNAKTEEIPYGEKVQFLRDLFASRDKKGMKVFSPLVKQVRDAASVCKKWPPESRFPDRPFWWHVELAGQPDEVRQEYAVKTIGRDAIRAALNIPDEPRRPKTLWQQLHEQFPESICSVLLKAAETQPPLIILKRIEAVLGADAYDGSTPPEEYMPDYALIDDAQFHVRQLEAEQDAEDAENEAKKQVDRRLVNFPARGKIESSFQSQNDVFSAKKSEFIFEEETDDFSPDFSEAIPLSDVAGPEPESDSETALREKNAIYLSLLNTTQVSGPDAAPAVSTLTVTPADRLAPYAALLKANLPEATSPPIPVPNCRGVTATGNPRLAVVCAARNIRNGTGTGGPRGQVAILAAVLTWYERQAAQTVTL